MTEEKQERDWIKIRQRSFWIFMGLLFVAALLPPIFDEADRCRTSCNLKTFGWLDAPIVMFLAWMFLMVIFVYPRAEKQDQERYDIKFRKELLKQLQKEGKLKFTNTAGEEMTVLDAVDGTHTIWAVKTKDTLEE
jgi:hypothetical protein